MPNCLSVEFLDVTKCSTLSLAISVMFSGDASRYRHSDSRGPSSKTISQIPKDFTTILLFVSMIRGQPLLVLVRSSADIWLNNWPAAYSQNVGGDRRTMSKEFIFERLNVCSFPIFQRNHSAGKFFLKITNKNIKIKKKRALPERGSFAACKCGRRSHFFRRRTEP